VAMSWYRKAQEFEDSLEKDLKEDHLSSVLDEMTFNIAFDENTHQVDAHIFESILEGQGIIMSHFTDYPYKNGKNLSFETIAEIHIERKEAFDTAHKIWDRLENVPYIKEVSMENIGDKSYSYIMLMSGEGWEWNSDRLV
jgi:hypothetical protein